MRLRYCIFLSAVSLAACAPNWVSPFSADLQKRATDMLADVTALEITLAQTSDTNAADPAQPAMQGKLAGWIGQVEAMAAIENAIDPQSAACDKTINSLAGAAIQSAEAQATPTDAVGIAGSAPLVLKCESLPDIFARMREQLVARIPKILAAQCAAGQPASLFAARCQVFFKPAQIADAQARHGLVFSPLVNALDIVIFREGRQAPK